ncbi:MAG: hypothetical protein D6790_21190 [Caldilineae bacterium]|nr:MAG: hypothetical protein D6790_21190 [Caldilineae bacterium]
MTAGRRGLRRAAACGLGHLHLGLTHRGLAWRLGRGAEAPFHAVALQQRRTQPQCEGQLGQGVRLLGSALGDVGLRHQDQPVFRVRHLQGREGFLGGRQVSCGRVG